MLTTIKIDSQNLLSIIVSNTDKLKTIIAKFSNQFDRADGDTLTIPLSIDVHDDLTGERK